MTADPTPSPKDAAALRVPEGARLVHIGPSKTGTTTVQAGFHLARPALAAQGVYYAGSNQQPARAARGAAGRPGPRTGKPVDRSAWEALVQEVGASDANRVVVSSEHLAAANDEQVRAIVEELGADRVHVVATLRPLARIIPSTWQQAVQTGSAESFDDWLRSRLGRPESADRWDRLHFDRLIRRWTSVVGPDRMTVVFVDGRDPGMLLRSFEALVGLTEGTLVSDPYMANRSLTWPEVEVIRALNARFAAEHVDRATYHGLVSRGAAAYLKRLPPPSDAPSLGLPAWAVETVATAAQAAADAIVGLGVRIVGDPAVLAEAGAPSSTDTTITVTPDLAAAAAMGVALASGRVRGAAGPAGTTARSDGSGPRAIEPIDVARLSTPRLTRILAARYRATLRTRLRRSGG